MRLFCRVGAASRLSVLVANILQVSRLENRKIRPSLQPFNVSEALCRCILDYDTALEEKNIELDTDLDQDLILSGDEALLDTVWNNLLSNAVKFTPEGGTIQIGLKQDDSHATQGNGLGLALAKRIVNLLEGEIIVHSSLGKGSVFTVRLRK